ncbi:MAG: hypothetical protein PHD48_06390 [Alphaproteobacteria bacterium]|nr:hypothetical protein [Alphaproteobacteria bacterium]
MTDDLHIQHDAITILKGDERFKAMHLLKAEGQTFVPKHQDIVHHELQRGIKPRQHNLHLDGVKFSMPSIRRNPIFDISLKNRRMALRYQPKLVRFEGNEAIILFDKRRPKMFMKWIRMFAAVMPFRMGIQNDPAPHCIVCRLPAKAAKLFLAPALNHA